MADAAEDAEIVGLELLPCTATVSQSTTSEGGTATAGRGLYAAQLGLLSSHAWSGSGGSGLGLYTVAATVAAHLGAGRCLPLARGTRFTITLPLAADRHVLA